MMLRLITATLLALPCSAAAPKLTALVIDGTSFPLGTRTQIGRSSACDLVLADDDTVSRHHAEIALRGGVCVIRDLDSCNGIYVNGRARRRARLRRGDELQLGETVIRLR